MTTYASKSALSAISRAAPSAISLSPTAAILRRWEENGTLGGHIRYALIKASEAGTKPPTDPDIPSQESLRVLDPSPQISLDEIQQYLGRGRIPGSVWSKNFSRAIAENAYPTQSSSAKPDANPTEAGPLWKEAYGAATDLHQSLSPLQSLMREYVTGTTGTAAPKSETADTTGTVVPPPTPMDLETLANQLEARVKQHLEEESVVDG